MSRNDGPFKALESGPLPESLRALPTRWQDQLAMSARDAVKEVDAHVFNAGPGLSASPSLLCC